VDSIKLILSALKLKDVEADLLQLVKRLVSADGYASKLSAI
jgi:hypothetical protein